MLFEELKGKFSLGLFSRWPSARSAMQFSDACRGEVDHPRTQNLNKNETNVWSEFVLLLLMSSPGMVRQHHRRDTDVDVRPSGQKRDVAFGESVSAKT